MITEIEGRVCSVTLVLPILHLGFNRKDHSDFRVTTRKCRLWK